MKKKKFIERRGDAAYEKMLQQGRDWHDARSKDKVWCKREAQRKREYRVANPTKSKILHFFSVEGVQIQTRYNTCNMGRSFFISTQFNVERGYLGSYKGKGVCYKAYCPSGFVRHHLFYNDLNYDDGVVLVTRAEHTKIHAKLKRRGETVPTINA